jgi:23S rRNA pseudouridine1911/1915/1917 synthase
MEAPQRFEVPRDEAGIRLDRFLADRLKLTRSAVRKLLASGSVRIGTQVSDATSKGLALGSGEVVEVGSFTAPEEQEALPEPAVPLRFLAEGEGWVAVDKPAGMPVHPLREGETGTVLNALVARHPEVNGVGEGALRSGVVHRLDVDTSGALLVATEALCWERLREAFREHRVQKRYLAVVAGRAGPGELELPLYVAASRPARVRVAGPRNLADARLARTSWRVLRTFEDATLLEVEIETGFLHQIRVTLAHEGYPVLGDRTYAGEAVAARAERQLLHASHVSFDEIEATSPPPTDFADYLG